MQANHHKTRPERVFFRPNFAVDRGNLLISRLSEAWRQPQNAATMAMFLISPISNPDAVEKAAAELFPNDYFALPKSHNILIYFQGTARELSDKMGISTAENGTAVIVTVSNYFGRAPTDIWEWMKSRMERD